MTVDWDDEQSDEALAHLVRLRTNDVSPRRADRLRRRCHVLLQQAPPKRRTWAAEDAPLRRVVLPALGCGWCLAYLIEIVRCTAAIRAYFAVP